MDIDRCYQILELDPGASLDELGRAYKDLVNVWHPDRFSKSPRLRRKAEKKLKEINEAYDRIRSYLSARERLDERPAGQVKGPWSSALRGIVRDRKEQKPRNLAQTYPVTRGLARLIDYLMFGFLLTYLNVHSILFRLDIPVPLFPIIGTFVWVFLEAGMVTAFGTTPGKWLLKTRIIDGSLERPGYLNALRRSLSVWCNGMGTGIFFISPVTMAVSYRRLKTDGYAQWDREGRFYLIHGKVSVARYLAAILLILVFSFLSIREIRIRLKAVPSGQVEETGARARSGAGDGDGGAAGPDTAGRETRGTRGPDNDYAEAQYRLGKACYELGRYEEAIEALKKVIRIRPGFAQAHYGLGISYANLRMYKEAREALARAIELKPRYAEAHQILGFVYLDTGDREAAIREQEVLEDLDRGLAHELLAYIQIPLQAEDVPFLRQAPGPGP